MNTKPQSIRDILYEKPGAMTCRLIRVGTVLSALLLVLLLGWVIYLFDKHGQLHPRYWSFFLQPTTWRFIGEGLSGTLQAALVAGATAFLAGLAMMLLRLSSHKICWLIGSLLIEFTRSVPTLLFIYFFFLVVPQLGITLPALWKIAAPVAISASGTVAEILRSGVNAVPKGQREAGLSLGMTAGKVFYKIIFPQAFRYVIPGLIANLVIVVKDTTFSYIVNFPDLMQNVKVLISNYDAMLSVYLVVALLYILINYLLNLVSVLAAQGRFSLKRS